MRPRSSNPDSYRDLIELVERQASPSLPDEHATFTPAMMRA
jgi:hypothetical protein